MPKLKLSSVIQAPPEEVFEYVTSFGKEGPRDSEAFQKKYGKVKSQEGNVFLTHEEAYGSETSVVKWRCTFDYPRRRDMEAVDSRWADRTDTFESTTGGTKWTVEWRTKTLGLKGLIQLIYFKLRGKNNYYDRVQKPVVDHFQGR